MRALKRGFWAISFAAVPILVLAQVAWWANVFTRDAELIATLQTRNVEQAARVSGVEPLAETLNEIREDAFHRKLMFLSESGFFVLLTFLGIWVIFRSVRNERRLREGQRSFIEMVSHESKTPLTGLKLRLEALREGQSDPQAIEELGEGLEEVRRLSGVLEKTLELNRSERHALQFEALSFAEVVQSVLSRLKPWLSAQQVEIRTDLDSEVIIHGDFPSLQGSVQSLLENAVQYNTANRKRVELRIAGPKGRAILSITDNGPGISADERRRIFDRFYRGQTGVNVPGTGLGLYFSKAIVEAHHGFIRLGEVGQGARFEIDLPRVESI